MRGVTGAPAVLQSVGFQPSKQGAGDKEPGYSIGRSRLWKLAAIILLGFLFLCTALVKTNVDVGHAYKVQKSYLRKQVRTMLGLRQGKISSLGLSLTNLTSRIKNDIHMNMTDLMTGKASEIGIDPAKAKLLVQAMQKAMESKTKDAMSEAVEAVKELQKTQSEHVKTMEEMLVEFTDKDTKRNLTEDEGKTVTSDLSV